MLSEDTTIKRNPRVAYRDLAEDTGGVLLHLDTAQYHGVNNIGALIWSLLGEQGISFTDLVGALRDEVQGAPPELAEEISDYLEGLRERDLVSIEPEPPAPQG